MLICFSIAKIEEPYIVSRYSTIKSSKILRQNSRSATVADKPAGSEQGTVSTLHAPWKDAEMEESEETNRYFLDSSPLEEANHIKELESLTLLHPTREDLYLTLVQRYINSRIPNNKPLALAALSEALEHNPKSGVLWRRYILLYNEIFPNPSGPDWTGLMEFCDDTVDLDGQLWNTRVNLLKTNKANTIEKYISRLLEAENTEKYEVELVNAILYRSFLYTIELNFVEAALTISQFIEIHPFQSENQCLLWLVYTFIHLHEQFPTSVLSLQLVLDLTRPIEHFRLDENVFDPHFPTSSSSSITLPQRKDFKELVSDLKSGVEG